jgi:hypothetical protein
MKTSLRTFLIASAIAAPTLFVAPIGGQTTDPTVLAAQNQQAIADANLKTQQDQQAALTGMLPTSTATPNTGAYTVTGSAPFPSQKIAYNQLKTIAHNLVRDCSGTETNLVNECDTFKNVQGVVMFDTGEIGNLLNYNALLATLNLMKDQTNALTKSYNTTLHDAATPLETLQPPVAGAKDSVATLIPGLVLGSLKTVTDIIGMFRTNTSVAYNSYTADDTALTAVVSRELLAAGKGPVFLPAQMPLSLQLDYAASPFMTLLRGDQNLLLSLQTNISTDQSKLQELSDALGAYIAADQAAKANDDATSAETDSAKKKALGLKKNSLDTATTVARDYALTLYKSTQTLTPLDVPTANVNKARIDHLLKSIALVSTVVSTASTSLGAVQSSLITVSATGTSPLTAIIRAEALLNKVTTTKAVILAVKTSVLGGAVVTRQNLFTGGHLFYTGGAIVNFTLFDVTGTILHSGVLVSDDSGKYVKY